MLSIKKASSDAIIKGLVLFNMQIYFFATQITILPHISHATVICPKSHNSSNKQTCQILLSTKKILVLITSYRLSSFEDL
jgi:hypothetical protein